MLSIRLKHYQFIVTSPFAEGTVLTQAEAEALNALRAENIRAVANKLLAQVTPAGAGDLLTREQLADLQARITEYDHRYAFPLKHRPRSRQSDIDAEARAIAEERLDAEIRRFGATEFANPRYRQNMVETYAALPAVQEEARRRVAERARIVIEGLEDL